MKKFILSWIALNTLVLVFSQPNAVLIYGKLTDQNTGEVIIGASIKLKGQNIGTFSDSTGIFRLPVPTLPSIVLISHISFEPREIIVENQASLVISLVPKAEILGEVKLQGKAFQTTPFNSTYPAYVIGQKRLRQSPSPSVYDLAAYTPGIDITTPSLTFKTPSSRGFNGSGSTRVNQIVDGMDNQAPGLNFFVGNFAGITDLDLESIELLPGASSALYGPGGMNGTILINSKNPFKYQGLSITAKQGIMHLGKSQRDKASAYNDYSLRWAKAFKDKFAIKIGAQYLSANDWLAGDSSNYLRSGTSGKLISGTRATDPNYDGVNVYGDETSVDIRPFIQGAIQANPGLQPVLSPFLNDPQKVSRTGYHEKDVIDPITKNIKLSGALHYKITKNIEAILMGYWSTGNTVYTDDNRYALKGIKIGQYKLELKHKNWFVRSYTTQEDAGEAYSSTVATQYVNEAWKRSFNPANIPGSWYPQYLGAFATGAGEIFQKVLMSGGTLEQAQAAVLNGATMLHAAGRAYADRDRPEAGSPQFKQIFDKVRKTPIPEGGLFKEQSQLWMTEGQYTFGDAVKSAEIIVGGNYKKYILDSDGTIFIDTSNSIGINEMGAYMQVTKKLFEDKLTLSTSGRFDKNENFKAQFTPRFAALVKLAKNHNLRMSYQTAYRFPGNLAQWIRLEVGGGFMLLGGLPWVMEYMQAAKNPVFESGSTTPYVYKEFKPETMRSFEAGYKALIKSKLLIDAYAYIGKYEDFLGRIGLYQPATKKAYSIVINSTNKVKTHGYGLGMDYRMRKNYSMFINVYSDVITDVPSGFKAYFNTPKYRMNAGFANDGMGKNKKVGFNIMMRWQDAFEWEGELANGPLKAFATVDAQVSYTFPKIKSTIRLGGTNIFNHYYQNGYANPSIGGLYYAMYAFNL
ncbi:MAG: TonB-dependent receptor domain-containing protein [Chitinophagaceae bacterium]